MSLAGVRLTRPDHSRLLALIIGLIITACALSPQTVTIYPILQLPSRDIGRGRTIALEVIDARSSQSFGVRGGIYQETSVINPSGEIKVPVRNALATALHNYRFAVALPGVSAPLAMTVTIEDIRYTPSGAPLVNGESYMEVERVTRIPGRSAAWRNHSAEPPPVFRPFSASGLPVPSNGLR